MTHHYWWFYYHCASSCVSSFSAFTVVINCRNETQCKRTEKTLPSSSDLWLPESFTDNLQSAYSRDVLLNSDYKCHTRLWKRSLIHLDAQHNKYYHQTSSLAFLALRCQQNTTLLFPLVLLATETATVLKEVHFDSCVAIQHHIKV